MGMQMFPPRLKHSCREATEAGSPCLPEQAIKGRVPLTLDEVLNLPNAATSCRGAPPRTANTL